MQHHYTGWRVLNCFYIFPKDNDCFEKKLLLYSSSTFSSLRSLCNYVQERSRKENEIEMKAWKRTLHTLDFNSEASWVISSRSSESAQKERNRWAPLLWSCCHLVQQILKCLALNMRMLIIKDSRLCVTTRVGFICERNCRKVGHFKSSMQWKQEESNCWVWIYFMATIKERFFRQN